MKLMAAEIVYLYGGGKFYRSYISELDDAFSREGVEGLRKALAELEGGGVFRRLLSIENFLEGDYFSWYLDELDGELAEAFAEVSRRLSDYEIATPQLEPEFARDLLKRLYQNLVPRELRHRLGEYYTPDWLANFLLDEVGLSYENIMRMGEEDPLKPLKIRVLDPACGSGTFLVLYISRLRRYAEEHYLTDVLLGYLLTNVVGYDLNPLAVLTARTNYLLAVADLLAHAKGPVELPVYLSDSIMIERETKLEGSVYLLRTSAGEFSVPVTVVEKGLLSNVLNEVSKCLENKYSVNEFRKRLEFVFRFESGESEALARLYEVLLKLEMEGRNRVWVAIIRNAFAPLLKGKFDYVVGNPPWVNWENLPESYREVSKSLWDYYGLTELAGKAGLGKVKKDLAMLFLARCYHMYLKEGGVLGFLVPFTLFKTQAGAGFRRYLARRTRIRVVHDLVTLYPFEGAVNRTAVVVVEKVDTEELDPAKIEDENLSGGIKHVVWVNPSKKPVSTDKPLEEVLRETRRYHIVMVPPESKRPESPWMQLTPKIIEAVRKLLSGPQYYEAHAGVYVGLNQVYFVRIMGKTPDGRLVITNPPEPGQKKTVKHVEAIVELDLIYPIVRGKDVKRWYVEFRNRYIILPVKQNGETISHLEMKTIYPGAYDYFYTFFDELVRRVGEPYKSKLRPYTISPIQVAEKNAPPFYWVFNVKPSLAPYKVVWKRIAGAITGKAVSFACAVITPINGKPVIVDGGTTILVNTDDVNEAYYLAGILNSLPSRAIIASYSYELRQETHIVDFIKIPKFDPLDKTHSKIAELSKRAHELSNLKHSGSLVTERYNIKNELEKVEKEIDLAVAELFGLSEKDLREFEKLMAILSGKEPPEEPEEVEPVGEPIITISNTLVQPDTPAQIEIDVTNPQGTVLEISYEFTWGSGTFKIVEGKHIIQTPPLKPGKYVGRLEYALDGVKKSIEVVIEVQEQTGPKRRRTLQDLG
jgi:type II restriction/modification system DNA methylase subunit YeeA